MWCLVYRNRFRAVYDVHMVSNICVYIYDICLHMYVFYFHFKPDFSLSHLFKPLVSRETQIKLTIASCVSSIVVETARSAFLLLVPCAVTLLVLLSLRLSADDVFLLGCSNMCKIQVRGFLWEVFPTIAIASWFCHGGFCDLLGWILAPDAQDWVGRPFLEHTPQLETFLCPTYRGPAAWRLHRALGYGKLLRGGSSWFSSLWVSWRFHFWPEAGNVFAVPWRAWSFFMWAAPAQSTRSVTGSNPGLETTHWVCGGCWQSLLLLWVVAWVWLWTFTQKNRPNGHHMVQFSSCT